MDDETGQTLPKEKLILLTSCRPVLDYLSACDHILYQCIVDFLITDVLRPIPATLTQAIRNFAKSLEGWLTSSIQDYPTEAVSSKVSTISFGVELQSDLVRWAVCTSPDERLLFFYILGVVGVWLCPNILCIQIPSFFPPFSDVFECKSRVVTSAKFMALPC